MFRKCFQSLVSQIVTSYNFGCSCMMSRDGFKWWLKPVCSFCSLYRVSFFCNPCLVVDANKFVSYGLRQLYAGCWVVMCLCGVKLLICAVWNSCSYQDTVCQLSHSLPVLMSKSSRGAIYNLLCEFGASKLVIAEHVGWVCVYIAIGNWMNVDSLDCFDGRYLLTCT